MDQKALQKSMGRLKTANKFRLETEFDDGALGDNLDINEDCRKRDLEKIFSKYGPLREIWLASYAPFYAFINYESRGDMEVKINDKKVC